jgi:hypothetical protein
VADETTPTDPVMVKANELAEALVQSQEFKDRDWDKQTLLITECNRAIAVETKINYGATASSCCG